MRSFGFHYFSSYNSSPLKTAGLIQSDLAKVGIKINIQPVEGNLLENKLSDCNHNMVLDALLTDSNDPDSFSSNLFSCQAIDLDTNWHKCSNSYLDEIYARR
ncbi:MAG: ABC transporter substrate-binding protein [Arsenophonus sp. NEOnobi-MAG3]